MSASAHSMLSQLEGGVYGCQQRQDRCLHATPWLRAAAAPRWPERRREERRAGCARLVTVAAAATDEAEAAEDTEDLIQFKDREKWYAAKFASDDAPDWQPARFVSAEHAAPGLKLLTLAVEISRDRVPLRNAYKHVGQQAAIRVNSGTERVAAIASPPPSLSLNRDALLKVRGDMTAGEIKKVVETIGVAAPVQLLVTEDDGEDLWQLTEGDSVEVGPFTGTGLDLRRPIRGFFAFPTIIIFCEGIGIAAAKALIEATPDVNGLNFDQRADVRMYYRARNDEALCFKHLYETWREAHSVRVITSTRDTFEEMFDNDDTLMYEPVQTAAVILTGGATSEEAEEAEKAAVQVCKDAEITELVLQSEEQVMTQYLTADQRDLTGDFTTKLVARNTKNKQ